MALLLVGFSYKGFSQAIPCPVNIDFELGDTTGWTAAHGAPAPDTGGVQTGAAGSGQTFITTPYPGFVAGRHDITNTSMPNDPYGNFPVVAANGGNHAIKIGDDNASNGADAVSFYFTVPIGLNTYSINYLYAVVIENPTGHSPEQMPRFTVSITDSATGLPLKDGCYDQNYVAASGLPGFFDFSGGVYKPWTKAVLNVSGAAGTTVKITITTGDCSLGGHFGYGYFDVLDCGEYKTILANCDLDRDGITLTAPEGYMTYEWYDNGYTTLADTGRVVNLFPQDALQHTYHVIMTPYPSVSSCPDTITSLPYANILLQPTKDTICMPPGGVPMQLNSNVQGGCGPLTYEWSELYANNSLSCTNCASPKATVAESNFYTVKVTDTNGCFRTRTVYMGINENKLDAIDDFVFCHPGYTTLNVEPSGPLPLDSISCGSGNAVACTSSNLFEVHSTYTATLSPYGSIMDSSYSNNPFAGQYSSAHLQYILRKKDLYFSGLRYGSLSSLGVYVVDTGNAAYENFTISLSCTDQTSVGGYSSSTLVYSTASYTPVLGWNDFLFDIPYSFDTSKNLLVDICFTNPDIDTPAAVNTLLTGGYDGYLEYTSTAGSSVCQSGLAEGSSIYVGRPVTRLGFCKGNTKPFEYTWTPGFYLSDSTIKSPLAYIDKTTKYYVESIGGSDCKIIDSVTITVPIHDYDIYPKDTSVCFNEPFQLNALGTFSSVKWFEYNEKTNTFTVPTTLTCGACADANASPNPIALPTVSDTLSYAVEFTDKDACNDTLYMHVVVRPLPPVQILTPDTTIKYSAELMLLAQGAYLYNWWPTGNITNPNIVNPTVSPTEPTMYYVYGTGENGCRNIDSVMINIDYNLPVIIPNAFTPNGDGKNDIFRPTTLKFKRLQEFRVFNRWGQEIFSTTDVNGGWDGSWRGVPQDMGVYQYIIKVASPEGNVEIYKGDVTLVR